MYHYDKIFNYILGIQELNEEKDIIHRRAVRAVIIKENSILMVHTNKGDYKFPGGGVSSEESDEEALKREVIEETGFIISNVNKEIGIVTERRADAFLDNSIFEMISCYYLCEISNTKTNQQLDDYEAELDYQPVWISIDEAINSNETILENDSADTNSWVHRENIVLKELKEFCNSLN